MSNLRQQLTRRVRGQRSKRSRWEFPRGAAVVELAVTLPLLAFLFVISVDFARVYYFSVTLTNSARAGAMYASDPSTQNESPFANVEAAALADAKNLSPPPTISSSSGVDASGKAYVEVSAAYTFSTITGFPGVPNNVNLVRTVRMNVSASTPKTN
jgi:Flp pilus assembly protein TadG